MLHELGLDERDQTILSLFMSNPQVSQGELAHALGLSQPSVNSRVQKLKARGLLKVSAGIDVNQSGLIMTRVDFTARDPSSVLGKLEKCSFFVNGFVMSGKNNVSVFLINKDLKKVDEIITKHIRSVDGVSDVSANVVVSSVKDFIIRFDVPSGGQKGKCLQVGGCQKCAKCG